MFEKLFDDLPYGSDYKLIYVTTFGSHLYGTNTEKSDTDYMGIYIPSSLAMLTKTDVKQISTTTGKMNSKNDENDVDIKLYSIHSFLNLLKKGETGAIDLLFSMFEDSSTIYENTDNYKYIHDFKSFSKLLLSKKLGAFTGYCLGQINKYGIRGKRYLEAKELYLHLDEIKFDGECDPEGVPYGKWTVAQWGVEKFLKDNEKEFIHITEPNQNGHKFVSFLGKKYNYSAPAEDLYIAVANKVDRFGHRAKSSNKEGVDHKAVSHAYRILRECEDLVENQFIQFPLPYADEILKIKQGNYDREELMDDINDRIEKVNLAIANSDLQTEVSSEFINSLILSFYS